MLNYIKLALILAFCTVLWEIRMIALWWIWFKSGATKLSSVSVVCVLMILLCEYGMFVWMQ